MQLLGKKGRVTSVEEDGDAVVSFGDVTVIFNPECLTQVSGEPDSIEITEVAHTGQPEEKIVTEPIPQKAYTKTEPVVNGQSGDPSEQIDDTIEPNKQTSKTDLPMEFNQHTESVESDKQRETIPTTSMELGSREARGLSDSVSEPQISTKLDGMSNEGEHM